MKLVVKWIVWGACLSVGGCVLVAAPVAKLIPEKVPAKYAPAKEPLVVLAENYENPSVANFESEQLASRVADQLKRKLEGGSVISCDEVAKLRNAKGQAVRQMTISAIGQAVGAKQVIYIDIRKCQLEEMPGVGMLKGEMTVQVKVVDSQTGLSRWPSGASEGVPLSVDTPYFERATGVDEMHVRQEMCRNLGVRIARLFYEYNADEGED